VDKTTLINPDLVNYPALVIGLTEEGSSQQNIDHELQELTLLLSTLGIAVAGRVVQKNTRLSPAHLIGQGKIAEIKELARAQGARLIVFDHPLSGTQVRNLEVMTNCQVLDRSGVILDIFARHAHSSQAQTQVEIAQLQYLLPRLTGAWTHFHRQAGGGGVTSRGMGETQIEIDRRRARERISRLQKRLEQIRKEKKVQRKSRQNELKVSLVGYTNSGKTTLMHGLTRHEQLGKDELFATLDTSVRVIDPARKPKILLSDTVGFIRKLPASLLDSFKSTLDEACNADLLLHVVDLSHSNYQEQLNITEAVLAEISAKDIPTIIVFNKLDATDNKFLPRILKRKYPDSIAISSLNSEDLRLIRDYIFKFFQKKFLPLYLKIPVQDQSHLSLVYNNCVLQGVFYQPEHVLFSAQAPELICLKLQRFSMQEADFEGEVSNELNAD
jgi:GTP-binding protein HflX